MAGVAPGIEQRGDSLRLTIDYQGQRIRETHPGECDPAHLRRVIKRREWLLARLRVGLPIYENDARLLSHIFDDWINTRQVKRSTLRSDENIWKNYWSRWGALPPDAVTSAMIKRVLFDREVAPHTQRNALSVLSSVLTHAEVNPNPCATIKIKRGQRQKVQRYKPQEIEALLAKLTGAPLVYFTVMASTGMRPGEILALEWSDWDGEHLDVSKQIVRRRLTRSTKTDVARRVYVPTRARDALNGHDTRFRGGYVFQNSRQSHHCDTDVFNGAWKRAHEKARLPYRIPYTLRHSRAAALLSSNVPIAMAAQQMGHSVQMFLSTYSEFIQEYSGQDVSILEGSPQPLPGESNDSVG